MIHAFIPVQHATQHAGSVVRGGAESVDHPLQRNHSSTRTTIRDAYRYPAFFRPANRAIDPAFSPRSAGPARGGARVFAAGETASDYNTGMSHPQIPVQNAGIAATDQIADLMLVQ